MARPGGVALCLAALVLACTQTVATADHGGAVATVDVEAGAFIERTVHVAPGGTVTWEVRDAGHSIRADDDRFHFGTRVRGLAVGDRASWTAGDAPEVVRFHCEVHGGPGGQGMSGVLVVGDPRPEQVAVDVLRVPQDVPTLAEAVAVLPRGRIEVAPGEYVLDEPLLLDGTDVHGVHIVGTGRDPSEVHLRGDGPTGQLDTALLITGTHVTVENLTVSGARRAAIHLDGANQAGLTDVHIAGSGITDDGVLITDGPGNGAGLQRVHVDAVRRAGIRIEPCPACGITVQAAEIRDSLVGIVVTSAVGVLIESSVVEGNSAGVIVRATPDRPSSVHLLRNVIRANTRPGPLPPDGHPDRELATGIGIDLRDAFDTTVADNTVEGHPEDVRFARVAFAGAQP